MFLVLSRSDAHFGFEHPFLRARSGAQLKIKIGLLERNLSTPVLVFLCSRKNYYTIGFALDGQTMHWMFQSPK